MTAEFDLDLGDGQTLHAYDAGGGGGLAVFWHRHPRRRLQTFTAGALP
jgi:hypothetical protein